MNQELIYLYVLGYLIYILILEKTRVTNKKLKPCTKFSILIGYKNNYIYRVYILLKKYNKIIYLSNYKFD
jgi:hypothetical protein